MLQVLDSQTTVLPAPPSSDGPAPEAFGPFLRLSMNETALLAPHAAQRTADIRAAESLMGPQRQTSAAGQRATEALARAQGQTLGVNLAEIAAGELASPGDSGRFATEDPALRRHSAAPESGDSRAAGRDARPGAGGSEQRGGESRSDRAEGDAAAKPPPHGAARGQGAQSDAQSTSRNQFAMAAAQGPAGSGGAGGAGAAQVASLPAMQGAGQIQATGGAPTAPGSAWKLDSPAIASKPAAAGSPATPREPSQALQTQLERGLSAVLRQGGGSLTLRLNPAALGEVRVHMTMDHGSVRARFESGSAETRELMTAGLSALRVALEARGLRVESLEVAPEPHERAERPVAETSREPGRPHDQPQPQRNGGEARGGEPGEKQAGENDLGRREDARGSARDGQDSIRPGEGAHNHSPEDPAAHDIAGDASETLVTLRLDTVA